MINDEDIMIFVYILKDSTYKITVKTNANYKYLDKRAPILDPTV